MNWLDEARGMDRSISSILFSSALTLSLSLAGCGSDSDSGGGNSNGSGGAAGDAITGAWSICTATSTEDRDSSELFRTVVGNGEWEDTVSYYTDEACQDADTSADAEVTNGTYTLGNEVTIENVGQALEVMWTYNQASDNPDPCYSLVYVQDGRLFFGLIDTTYTCSSTETRPITIDFENGVILEN